MPPLADPISLGLALFGGGFLAGFVDAVAGGGGLIALPVLFLTGLPPHVALGTNKLQGTFGTLSATLNYTRSGKVALRETRTGVLFTLIGAALGAVSLHWLDPGVIRHLVPVLLVAVFLYTLFSPRVGDLDRKPRMGITPFFIGAGTTLGFYDGFFGPGTGSFWTAALVFCLGHNMTRAVGVTKVMNFTSNIVALTIFILAGTVNFAYGLTMAAGQTLGALAGSSIAIRKGTGFIRPVFLTVVLATILRMAWLSYM